MKHTHTSSQSGSVLFYILIAVALFAALSYSVSGSLRDGNTETLSEDKAKLYATEIIDYANTVANAVAQTKLRGYSDTEISFENPIVSGYENPNCIDDICKIFNKNGGGINYKTPPAEWFDAAYVANNYHGEWFVSRSNWIKGVGTDGVGSSCNGGNGCIDLILALPYLNIEICKKINKLVGHGKNDGTPLLDAGNSVARTVEVKFKGIFSNSGASMGDTIPDSDDYDGKLSGCVEAALNPPPGTYTFYKVLIAR